MSSFERRKMKRNIFLAEDMKDDIEEDKSVEKEIL